MNKFVEVPRSKIASLMEGAGFEPYREGGELSYRRFHGADKDLMVVVMTSVPFHGDEVRDCGEDAIRVLALADIEGDGRGDERVRSGLGRRKALFRAKILRVNSVDGVLSRIMEKTREAYSALNDAINTRCQREPAYCARTKPWRERRAKELAAK